MKDYRFYITPQEFEIAKNNGIDEYLVTNRVYRLDWDIKKAITTPKQERNRRETVFGKEVLKRIEENGISYQMFYQRVRGGWSIEEAINTPKLTRKEVGKRTSKKYEANGYKCGLKKEHFDIAKSNGVNRCTVYNRVSCLHWSIERAITEPPNLEKCGYYTKLRDKQLKSLEG